jgi:Icc protein
MAMAELKRQVVPVSSSVVRLLQLTDTHLCQEAGEKLLGMDTDHSLQAVIDLALREQPQVDAVLGTGDMSNHGYLDAYQRLRGYFDRFDAPQFWLPGNHDDRACMVEVDISGTLLSNDIRFGGWQLVMLDSQVPGEVGGYLGEEQLALLRQALALAARENLHSLVCLHHHPLPIGCQWLDEQHVADADALFAVLAEFHSVRGVLWGHVHQEVDREWQGLRLLGSPSTCVQFAPGSDNFRADTLPPGYRWLALHADGHIETGVSRVWDVPFTVDLNSGGYLQD